MAAIRLEHHSGFLHKVITGALQAYVDTSAMYLLVNPAEGSVQFNFNVFDHSGKMATAW